VDRPMMVSLASARFLLPTARGQEPDTSNEAAIRRLLAHTAARHALAGTAAALRAVVARPEAVLAARERDAA
jgi:hypothetical protein